MTAHQTTSLCETDVRAQYSHADAGIDAQGSKRDCQRLVLDALVANGRWLISNVCEFSRFAPPAPTIVYPFAPGFHR